MYPGTYAVSAPDRPAVVVAETGEALTYADLDRESTRLARALREQGLRPGDVVAMLVDNTPWAFVVYWAARRSGFYITAINHHLAPDEAAYVVDDCGARALVVAGERPALRELAVALLDRTPHVTRRLVFGAALAGHEDGAALLAGTSAEPLDDQPAGIDMLYSSGTTGRPKGIKPSLPARRVDEPGDLLVGAFAPLYGFGEDTVYLSPAPVYHAAPLRFAGVITSTGGTVVLMRRFDPEAALAAIERYRVTHSQWVPTMFVRMLKLPADVRAAHDVSSQRVAIHAAAPCPVEVKQAMIDWWGPILHEYYGSTEGNGLTVIDSAAWSTHPGSVGRAALGVVHVCDDDGRELGPGEVGTVYFERDELPFTYHGDEAKTRSAQHPDHPTWTTTGDLGRVDGEGFLYLADRRSFMIISGGVNIYPQEVEDVLALHPRVLDVAVVGVPDEEMGESVLAVVSPAGEPEDDLAERLLAHVRGRIAGYKVPRLLVFDDDLPRTPTGKLVKHTLRARYADAAGVTGRTR